MSCSVTEVKDLRYSNTAELTKYYRSVFMKLDLATQQEILKALDRPKSPDSGNMSTKLEKKGPEEEEVVSSLVKSLRREPLTFVRRALEKVGVLGNLEPMLSIRRDEEEYEGGRLDSNNYSKRTAYSN